MVKQTIADVLDSLKGTIFSFDPAKKTINQIKPKIIVVFPLVLKLCGLKVQ